MDYNKEDILEFIRNPSNELYLNKVYPALVGIADWLVDKHCRNWYVISATKSDLIGELVSHAASNLHKYDSTKGDITTFIYRIITNDIHRKYQNSQYAKRNNHGKMLSLDRTIFIDDNSTILLGDTLTIDKEDYSYCRDKDFVFFYCQWWRNYKYSSAKTRIKKYVTFILDIVEHPERHQDVNNNYTNYICEHFGISRQYAKQVYDFMKLQSNTIRNDFNNGGILKLIFKDK